MSRAAMRITAITVVAMAAACGGGADHEPLAHVGDTEVTDEQFAAYLQFRSLSPRGDEEMDEELDTYLGRMQLTRGIEDSDVLDQALIDAELEQFRTEMLISRYFDRYLRTAVTDDAVATYYEAHAEEYEDREVHVAHVLIRTNRRMSDEERQVARTRAQEAHAQLRSGRPFAEVASEYSEDQVSSGRGGDLGWVREGVIDPRFSEHAFGQEADTYSEPFETPFGYHVIRVVEAPRTRRRPLSAVEGDIRYQLRAEAREAEITRLRGAVEIERRESGYQQPERPSTDPVSAPEVAEAETTTP